MRLLRLQPGIDGGNNVIGDILLNVTVYFSLTGRIKEYFNKWKPYKIIVEHLRREGYSMRYNRDWHPLNSYLSNLHCNFAIV